MRNENITLLPPAPGGITGPLGSRSRRSGFDLPPDLQAKACRRVAQFALLMTVLVAVVFLLSKPVWQDFTRASAVLIVRIMQAVIFVLSAALFLVARSQRLRHTVVLHLGLLYEFLFCLTVSIGYNWFTGEAYGLFAAINISTIVIAVYPMIVPSPTVPTLVTALASAATAPLGVFFASAFGTVEAHAADYLGVSTYPALCVVLAVFGSRIIHGLNRDVASARELGSYRLREMLGKGGMGEVWRADHRLLARPAAIKLVRSEKGGGDSTGADAQILQRFEREAQVTASLQSPHTVALYDFGCTEEGICYYVMELLDGLDLDTMVERYGPLPPERVGHILKQACLSLAEAHDAGLIHRDIKPANMLACRYGRDHDFVKVLDFGIVALRRGPQTRDDKLTTEGIVGGTPAYLAPEMAEGGQVDRRTDLYSLGCVAYWLLTGRTVFEGDTPLAMVLAHMKDDPVPPSRVSEIAIPRDLEDLVMACLAKEPGNRPASADALLARLEACSYAEPWTQARARQWWDAHRPRTVARADMPR